MEVTRLAFHSPVSGDYTVVVDVDTGDTVYSGHSGMSDILRDVLACLNVPYTEHEYTQEDYEELF